MESVEDGEKKEEEKARGVFLFACVAQKAGKHGLARAAWDKYLAVRPSDARGHFNRGTSLDALGETREALLSFERAFALQPTMADAAANAAGLLIRTGQAEHASTLCYSALAEDPTCSPALYNLNTALRMMGRQDEAVSYSWRWILERLVLSGACSSSSPAYNTAATAAAAAAAATSPKSPSENFEGHAPNNNGEHSLGETRAGAVSLNSSLGLAPSQGPTEDTSSAERGGGSCMTVACVRWGDKYGVEYVERLELGVRRHLSGPYRFVCFTDDVEALEGVAGVEGRTLGARCSGWRGWWNKAFIFSREARLEGRVLYIDLDTVITGSLDEIAGYFGPFAALSAAGMANERRSSGMNSSVMSWDSLTMPTNGAVHGLLLEAYEVVTACVHKFDHWLEMTVPGAVALQEAFPGQIVEYKADCCETAANDESLSSQELRLSENPAGSAPNQQEAKRGVDDEAEGDGVSMDAGGCSSGGGHLLLPPQNARIICFPLDPKPHEVEDRWVRRFWCGEDDGRGEKHTAWSLS